MADALRRFRVAPGIGERAGVRRACQLSKGQLELPWSIPTRCAATGVPLQNGGASFIAARSSPPERSRSAEPAPL